MHRSGTSAAAGMFEQAGLFVGSVIAHPSPFSPKGHREHRLIAYLNDSLLKANGGAWNNPLVCKWAEFLENDRDLIVAGMRAQANGRAWGFKCCRVLWSLEGWLKALPNLRIVGVFRHPSEVVSSLVNRNGMTAGKALELWAEYNGRLLYWHERLGGFPLINFSSTEFERQVKEACAALGLNAEGITDFYDPGLRSIGVSRVPLEAMAMYERLEEREVKPGGIYATA